MKVSYSRVSSYLHCPQQHHFSYVEGLSPKKPERPLSFGKDFHKLLELRRDKAKLKKAWKGIKEAYNELPTSHQAELGDDYLDNLKTIFKDYREIWKGQPLPMETEHEFLIPIGKLKSGEIVTFHGIIDEIYEDLVLGEHKTFSTAPDMGLLAMNTQVCLYAKAYELDTGKKLERVRWDYIKSTPPVYPIWLDKSGRFSEASNSKITPQSWLRACGERNITDEAILAKANNYAPNVSNFFFRVGVEFVPEMVDTVWDSFKGAVKDLAKRGENNKIKNITRNCSWCKFRPICFAEFTGADVEYVKATDYIVKERV